MRAARLSLLGIVIFLLAPLASQALAADGPNLRFTTQGDQVTVSWDEVEGAYDYEIKYGPVDQEGFANEVPLTGVLEYTFTLTGAKVFKVAVIAYGDHGQLLAVSALERVELPLGDVLGYFFLNLDAEYGTDTLPLAQSYSEGGVWVSIYERGGGEYTLYGLGDANYSIYYSHPQGGCTYTLTTRGQLHVAGTLVAGSGRMDLTLREVYEGPMTPDGTCFGIQVPETPFTGDWYHDVRVPLKKGAYDFGKDLNMQKYEVTIWETSLDGCPGCGG